MVKLSIATPRIATLLLVDSVIGTTPQPSFGKRASMACEQAGEGTIQFVLVRRADVRGPARRCMLFLFFG